MNNTIFPLFKRSFYGKDMYVIHVSRKGHEYNLPELMHITRKGKKRVVDNNHIIVEEVDDVEEKGKR